MYWMVVWRWTLVLQDTLTDVAFTGRKVTPAGLSVGIEHNQLSETDVARFSN